MSAKIIPFKKPPAVDESEYELTDLNRMLIDNPGSTYGLTASGTDLEPGICDGDVLIVDRSLAPNFGGTVIIRRGGDFVVQAYSGGEVWGVVTYSIHELK
jgi:DNA polymerase V